MRFPAFCCLFAVGVCGQLAAQAGGPYAPIVLLLPAGARTLALGNAGVVGRDDDAIFFNPAQLAVARGMSASGERYSATAGGGALSAITPFNGGGVGVGMRMVDYDAPANAFPATREALLAGGQALGTSLEAVIGLSQIVKGVRVGASAKYVDDQIAPLPSVEALALRDVRISRALLDVGFAKDLSRFASLGLAVQNIGSNTAVSCAQAGCPPAIVSGISISRPFDKQTVYLPLRTTLGVGGAWPAGIFDITATADASVIRNDYFVPAGGAEVGYSWLSGYNIAVRAGARRPLPGERALTVGAGLQMDRLTIDYALETLAQGRAGHRIGLRIR